ncbi:uncharacterized protein [Dysidea avara]|uniref:uncharacterized protein isoform X3 n=1 Tax=Dysidea avara TaxID=196820 RepID=UPI00332F9AAA
MLLRVLRRIAKLLPCCSGKIKPRSKQYKKNEKKDRIAEVDDHLITSVAQEHNEDRSDETAVEMEIPPILECNANSHDDIVECDESLTTTTTSQVTPRIVTVADVLNVVIEGLESAVERNEELQRDIAMNMSNYYKEMLHDTSELLQQMKENNGSLKERSTIMEEDNPTLVSMECHSDRSSAIISNNSCIYINDINCDINDCSSMSEGNNQLLPDYVPLDVADTYKCTNSMDEDSFNPRKHYSDWEDVMNDDKDLTQTSSSNEPTSIDIFNDIMEGLESAVEMNEEFYDSIATTIDTCTKETLNERNELLRQLEEIEETQKERSSLVEKDNPTIVSTECHSDSVSHSSIIHESDIDIDIDFKVCTTFAERHNNYIVPCTSMAATDHEPHEPSSDATVTYQCSIYMKKDNSKPTVVSMECYSDRNNLITSTSSDVHLSDMDCEFD